MLLSATVLLVAVLTEGRELEVPRDTGNDSPVVSVGSIAGALSNVGEAGISTETSKFPGGIVTVGTDKNGTAIGALDTSGESACSIKLFLSGPSCSEISFCTSTDLFDVTEAVVFDIFEATEFLELDEASEFTDPLLTVLSGGCSSSGPISVRDNVWGGEVNFSRSKAWKLILY